MALKVHATVSTTNPKWAALGSIPGVPDETLSPKRGFSCWGTLFFV